MYILNEGTKSLTEISETTFSENGLKERYDLQEWIDNNPEIISKELGKDEELLIIQKEFSNFDKTKERLDLLALDKKGNLVIIENKLDDSGKDVTWQALKYASYCSTLTKSDIISIYQKYLDKNNSEEKAEEKISDYLGGEDINVNERGSQRIILIAREFKPEVTSTVLWLRSYEIDIQCIKFTPYEFQDKLIIDVDKIIPLPETEEFTIKLAIKDAEDKNISIVKNIKGNIYFDYWSRLLESKGNLSLYNKTTASREHYIQTSAGISGVYY
ncbi:PD-(D/E)XK nuclease family protein, partial [Rodentibacter genomosp. 2]